MRPATAPARRGGRSVLEAVALILAGLALAALAGALWLFIDGLRARAQARRFNLVAPPPRARQKRLDDDA